MEFRGKINSLDVDYEALSVQMNVTADGKNFDIDYETYWDVIGDEFEGWEELKKSIPVMADISVGRMSLTVEYDGKEAYAYGDEAGTDIIEKNPIMEEKKLTYRDFVDMVRADNEAKNADLSLGLFSRSDSEFVEGSRYFNVADMVWGPSNVWNVPKPKNNKEHPTMIVTGKQPKT